MTDMIRLIHFKRETIETSIFTQDIIDGQIRGDREIKSFYMYERNKLQWWNRIIILVCMNLNSLTINRIHMVCVC